MAANSPVQPLSLCIGKGNTKLGAAYTFSLPSLTTCPGASDWCRKHCYALRLEKRLPNCRDAYTANLVLSESPELFRRQLLELLPEDAAAVRIHVGGDFYSNVYIRTWIRVCLARPDTQFWAYTRSWNVPWMTDELETLRALRNVQLFASVDTSMPPPPEGWRAAWIANDVRAQGLHCPEQQERVESCMACGYCFRNRTKGDVVFQVH